MRIIIVALLSSFIFGCDGGAPQAPPAETAPPAQVANAANLANAAAVPNKSAPGKIGVAQPKPDPTITTRPATAEYKPGCNYNTSCKANCEWCAFGTCTCRLKGIK